MNFYSLIQLRSEKLSVLVTSFSHLWTSIVVNKRLIMYLIKKLKRIIYMYIYINNNNDNNNDDGDNNNNNSNNNW